MRQILAHLIMHQIIHTSLIMYQIIHISTHTRKIYITSHTHKIYMTSPHYQKNKLDEHIFHVAGHNGENQFADG